MTNEQARSNTRHTDIRSERLIQRFIQALWWCIIVICFIKSYFSAWLTLESSTVVIAISHLILEITLISTRNFGFVDKNVAILKWIRSWFYFHILSLCRRWTIVIACLSSDKGNKVSYVNYMVGPWKIPNGRGHSLVVSLLLAVGSKSVWDNGHCHGNCLMICAWKGSLRTSWRKETPYNPLSNT